MLLFYLSWFIFNLDNQSDGEGSFHPVATVTSSWLEQTATAVILWQRGRERGRRREGGRDEEKKEESDKGEVNKYFNTLYGVFF